MPNGQRQILEFTTGITGKIDRENGVIHDVKLLGRVSRNGRRYSEAAITKAIGLYEGAKVNVNHPKSKADGPRDYQDRFGSVHGVYEKSDGLYAKDFKFNPKHGIAEQFLYDAENSPNNLGFSHNVLGKTKGSGSKLVVEEISKVVSMDLVADPATTEGLFEHLEQSTMTLKEWLESEKADATFVELIEASGADMESPCDDEKAKKLKKLMVKKSDGGGDEGKPKTEAVDSSKEIESLNTKIDGLSRLVESSTKRSLAVETLAAAGAKISQSLIEELTKLADGKAMSEAVASWSPAKLGKQRPKIGVLNESVDGGDFPKDHAGFLRELKKPR